MNLYRIIENVKTGIVEGLKRIYFAGTFCMDYESEAPLAVRLCEDYRAKLLGGPQLMVCYDPSVLLRLDESQVCHYVGPFYCEEAASGDFTSTDCEVVVKREREQVEASDLVVCLFDTWLSIGTTVELEWAIELKKDILIFYEIEVSEYTLPSGLWFVIKDAMLRGKSVKAIGYNSGEFVLDRLRAILTEYCETGILNS